MISSSIPTYFAVTAFNVSLAPSEPPLMVQMVDMDMHGFSAVCSLQAK